jgi:hypothetical protein
MASGTKGSPGDLGPTFSQSAAVRVNETIPARQAGAKRMKPDVVMRRRRLTGRLLREYR